MATTGPTGPVSVFLPLLALRSVAAGRLSAEARTAPLWLGGTVAWCLAGAVLGAEPWSGMADAIVTVLFGVLPWLVGRHLRQRGALLRAGWQRAESLERELAAVSEQERLRERARIAEEMHDSLGHELSLMAVRAGALEVAPGLTEAEFRSAAGDLREGAMSAIDRLQRIIGVLDADAGAAGAADGGTGDASASGPGRSAPDGIGGLVRRAAAAGMAVEWDGREVAGPDPVARLAEAVVREALTNAAKHAPGARVVVAVETRRRGRAGAPPTWPALRAGATTVAVSNGPPGGTAREGASGGGRGLAALAERVRAAGGSLAAGPRPGGGFRLAAVLPHRAAGALPRQGVEGRRPRRVPAELAQIAGVCVGLLLPLVVAWYAYAAHLDRDAALSAAEYARVTVGQERGAADAVLPEASLPDTALVPEELRRAAVTGPSADCAYYRSRPGPPWSPAFVYGVCFQDDRVVRTCRYDLARRSAGDALRCESAEGAAPRGGLDTAGAEGGAGRW
ncbi:signal transduction histidine kinase [Streptomonospora nanhaiensis]|uniref:histidine kinase n=1 Tax=Streptomonospora nanhaiensis TaxID=1323731 RepID=A0A853BUC8_9ACTN|nr:signal transduction histidine kinase [Streptomonospora nanhaiensis]